VDRIPNDSLELVVEAAIIKLLTKLPPGWPSQPLSVSYVLNGTEGTMTIGPPGSTMPVEYTPPSLTACQREVLAVVKSECTKRRRRVVSKEVKAGMRAAGHDRGDTAVQCALAMLVDLGLLVNDNDQRGYAPTGSDPG